MRGIRSARSDVWNSRHAAVLALADCAVALLISAAALALASLEKAVGPGDPALEKQLGNPVNLYRQQRHYAEAEPLYRRWLAIT
jgi:hypothetical protein